MCNNKTMESVVKKDEKNNDENGSENEKEEMCHWYEVGLDNLRKEVKKPVVIYKNTIWVKPQEAIVRNGTKYIDWVGFVNKKRFPLLCKTDPNIDSDDNEPPEVCKQIDTLCDIFEFTSDKNDIISCSFIYQVFDIKNIDIPIAEEDIVEILRWLGAVIDKSDNFTNIKWKPEKNEEKKIDTTIEKKKKLWTLLARFSRKMTTI